MATELSKNAQKMLKRLKEGRWYTWDPTKVPKAMEELEAAGLVTTAGRVQTIVRCWVPKEGFIPHTPERFEANGNG